MHCSIINNRMHIYMYLIVHLVDGEKERHRMIEDEIYAIIFIVFSTTINHFTWNALFVWKSI